MRDNLNINIDNILKQLVEAFSTFNKVCFDNTWNLFFESKYLILYFAIYDIWEMYLPLFN